MIDAQNFVNAIINITTIKIDLTFAVGFFSQGETIQLACTCS